MKNQINNIDYKSENILKKKKIVIRIQTKLMKTIYEEKNVYSLIK